MAHVVTTCNEELISTAKELIEVNLDFELLLEEVSYMYDVKKLCFILQFGSEISLPQLSEGIIFKHKINSFYLIESFIFYHLPFFPAILLIFKKNYRYIEVWFIHVIFIGWSHDFEDIVNIHAQTIGHSPLTFVTQLLIKRLKAVKDQVYSQHIVIITYSIIIIGQ